LRIRAVAASTDARRYEAIYGDSGSDCRIRGRSQRPSDTILRTP
jgi:hypothetical protein